MIFCPRLGALVYNTHKQDFGAAFFDEKFAETKKSYKWLDRNDCFDL